MLLACLHGLRYFAKNLRVVMPYLLLAVVVIISYETEGSCANTVCPPRICIILATKPCFTHIFFPYEDFSFCSFRAIQSIFPIGSYSHSACASFDIQRVPKKRGTSSDYELGIGTAPTNIWVGYFRFDEYGGGDIGEASPTAIFVGHVLTVRQSGD